MKKSEARKAISRFIGEISGGYFLKDKGNLVDEIVKNVCGSLNTGKEVSDYLDFVIEYIDDLNTFFKKEGKRLVSYDRLLNFARDKSRLGNFIFDKNAKKKFDSCSPPGMAGCSEEGEEEDGESGASSSVIFCKYRSELYEYLVSADDLVFLFSSKLGKIVVKNGKMISPYSLYRKRSIADSEKYVNKATLLREIDKQGIFSESAISYRIYIRQLVAKAKRKKARG